MSASVYRQLEAVVLRDVHCPLYLNGLLTPRSLALLGLGWRGPTENCVRSGDEVYSDFRPTHKQTYSAAGVHSGSPQLHPCLSREVQGTHAAPEGREGILRLLPSHV